MSNNLNQLTQTPLIQPGTGDKLNWPWIQFLNGLDQSANAAGVSSLNALTGALSITVVGGSVIASGSTVQITVTPPTPAVLKGDSFTPDSATQIWTLSSVPSGIVILVWNNLVRAFTEYSVVGTTLTTVFTAATGDNLFVIYL